MINSQSLIQALLVVYAITVPNELALSIIFWSFLSEVFGEVDALYQATLVYGTCTAKAEIDVSMNAHLLQLTVFWLSC